ncbi:hypothetical protein DC082_01275 [Ignatzschineria indica]|uniref:Uncharacterized protein n=1 Tax=Ignatzschineria indica TaxID=472583 RepID=A0A2U2AM31_9GAMM|nr:hypothetical protein DC082_01275 [Ignatzschineria indica]
MIATNIINRFTRYEKRFKLSHIAIERRVPHANRSAILLESEKNRAIEIIIKIDEIEYRISK